LKVVVLAAGRGERLSPYTDHTPKPLMTLLGKPLIEHVISSCRDAGLKEFIVVTGYLGNVIRNHLRSGEHLGVSIDYVENANWSLGNGSSLMAARAKLEGEGHFLLTMSDHIYHSSLIRRALDGFNGLHSLCVDRVPMYLTDIADATKVILADGGAVTEIGKSLAKWHGVDTGVFILHTDLFAGVKNMVNGVVDCMKIIINDSLLQSIDVSSLPWLDVDTFEDLNYARQVVGHWL
jgi:NDP-sugar pyrophosphorylase family protein